MSKESGTEPVSLQSGGRLRKIVLKTLILLFVFGLGFILSELRFKDQTDQVDNSHQFAYVYDTEQKEEDFYQIFERGFSEETGFPPESPEAKEFMAMVRGQGRPLVAVGPFAVFINNDGDTFSVREMQWEKGALFPLVDLQTSEQSKRLRLYSSSEKGFKLPRFHAQFTYSEDGVYERGRFVVHKDGMPERMYFDRQGIGVFDVMIVFEHEHGVRFIYSLNNLTWELVDEQWYSEEEKIRVDGLLEDYNDYRKAVLSRKNTESSDEAVADTE